METTASCLRQKAQKKPSPRDENFVVPPLFGSCSINTRAKPRTAASGAIDFRHGASLMHPGNAGSADLPTSSSAHRLASELRLAPHAARFQSRRAVPCTRASQGTLSVISFHHDTACASRPQPCVLCPCFRQSLVKKPHCVQSSVRNLRTKARVGIHRCWWRASSQV